MPTEALPAAVSAADPHDLRLGTIAEELDLLDRDIAALTAENAALTAENARLLAWIAEMTDVCPDCDGGGEVQYNPSRNDDPQCEESARCAMCHGTGAVARDVPRDRDAEPAVGRNAAAIPFDTTAFTAGTPASHDNDPF